LTMPIDDTIPDPVVIPTQHNDNSRTGANLRELLLTTSNVNQNQFGKLFVRPVDGQIYAQPLYVGNVLIPNKGLHNVVYVATMHNSVYAFDADDPTVTEPLWHATLEPSIKLPDVNIGPVDQHGHSIYHDIAFEVGILSTPVISIDNNVIYVVNTTKNNNGYAHMLHALDLTTGVEQLGGPVQIGASVPGNGAASSNGQITFQSHLQLQRSGLLLANDTVYIAFAGYGDAGPYHGWIFGYSAGTLERTAVFNTTPNGSEAGIWQAGQGPAADERGQIYFLTGNGTFTPDGKEVGDCFVKMRPNLTILDWFSPFNNAVLNAHDADVGSSGALLLPGTTLVVGGGKESKLYVMQRDSMGHFNPNNDNQIVQSFYVNTPDPHDQLPNDPTKTHHIHGGPIYWDGPGGPYIYVWTENDYMKAYQFANGRFATTPAMHCTTTDPDNVPGGSLGMPGGILSISANGNAAGSGIVWASHPYSQNANQAVVQGILRAYDASNLSHELWNSQQNAARDGVGLFAKFCPPTIANGKVYMASFSGYLAVYGLFPSS
jgi:hypothetical protein